MNRIYSILFSLVLIIPLTACDDLSGKNENQETGTNAVVVDLNAISKATGQDDIIAKKMDSVNASLSNQLQKITIDLNKQLAEHKERFGKSITVEQQQQLQELLIKANQQLELKQNEANLKSAQYKESLILAWREKVKPVVKTIADSKGAKVVLVQSPMVVWFDSTIDVTDEVMAELRANPIKADVVDGPVTEAKEESDTEKKSGDKKQVILPDSSGDLI